MRPQRAVIALVVGVAVVCVIGLLAYAQKTSERLAYRAATQGPACHVAPRRPDYVSEAALKSFDFGGARFRYYHGDVDCGARRPGRLTHDGRIPVCTFDRPEYLDVARGGTQTSYVVVIGQAIVTLDAGAPKCVVRAPA